MLDQRIEKGSSFIRMPLSRFGIAAILGGAGMRMCLTAHHAICRRSGAAPVRSGLPNTDRIRSSRKSTTESESPDHFHRQDHLRRDLLGHGDIGEAGIGARDSRDIESSARSPHRLRRDRRKSWWCQNGGCRRCRVPRRIPSTGLPPAGQIPSEAICELMLPSLSVPHDPHVSVIIRRLLVDRAF